ncbi:YncE family protein [Phreatobacter oligotrophus]|uniref:Lactonase family protein with 7-bladed beta-propeller n=1 Tax=Phreatobacter oligotrophus TaxID=1122261 RepID=A0A2T4YZG6_9HYPH|nr:beta-propeller fold lactonase family protein [Phreatobacter oligotrophus]PTM52354.1 lactonase family protein with 7-bladed beta-propeller [Phreatobacter oligotrophus]
MRLTSIRPALAAGLFVASAAGVLGAPPSALAQIAVSANDGKMRLVDGVATVVEQPRPDSVSIIDFASGTPRVRATIPAPASVVGPPVSVAVTADESLALVSSAMKLDPANPRRTIPDNRVSVIDLKAEPPVVIATLEVGQGAAGLSIHPSGTLAIVANRAEGTVSVLTIAGRAVTVGPKIALGEPTSGPSHVAFTPDGRTALVTRDNDHKISVLAIEGTTVTYTRRDLNAGLRPYGLDVSMRGDMAVVANIGIGGGDADTISLIDVRAQPPRVVNTVSVGQTPEGIKMAPDGRHVAVVVIDGSNKARNSPFFQARGKVAIYEVRGTDLVKVTEAPIGQWSQGAAWSADSRRLLVQNMVGDDIQVFAFENGALREIGTLAMPASPAAIRTAEPVRR